MQLTSSVSRHWISEKSQRSPKAELGSGSSTSLNWFANIQAILENLFFLQNKNKLGKVWPQRCWQSCFYRNKTFSLVKRSDVCNCGTEESTAGFVVEVSISLDGGAGSPARRLRQNVYKLEPSLDTVFTPYLKTKEVVHQGPCSSVVGSLLSVSKALDPVSLIA